MPLEKNRNEILQLLFVNVVLKIGKLTVSIIKYAKQKINGLSEKL